MSHLIRREFIRKGVLMASALAFLPYLTTWGSLHQAFSRTSAPNEPNSEAASPSSIYQSSGDKVSSLGFDYAMVSRNFWNAQSFEGNAFFSHNTSPESLNFTSTVTKAKLKSPSAATIGYSSIYYGHFGPGNTTSPEVSWLPMPVACSNFTSMKLVSKLSYSVKDSSVPFNLFYDLWCGPSELAISIYNFDRPANGTPIGTINLSDGSIWKVYRIASDTKGYMNYIIRRRSALQAEDTSTINLSEMLQSKLLGLRPSFALKGIGFGSEFLPNGSDLRWESTSWTLSSGSNLLKII